MLELVASVSLPERLNFLVLVGESHLAWDLQVTKGYSLFMTLLDLFHDPCLKVADSLAREGGSRSHKCCVVH